jgi:hypothetical protein
MGNQPGENRDRESGIIQRDTQRAQVAARNLDLAMTKRREPGEEEGIKVEGGNRARKRASR